MTNIYHNFFKALPTVVLIFLFCFQLTGQRATRQSAEAAFNRGDYERAYSEFNELLEIFTRDPLYKYYASVCLIKLEQEPEQAERLIKEAIENNTAARSIPSDVTFYLARALHQNGKFDEATALYQRFANQAGRRTARELRVQDYINQCSKGEGAIAKTQPEKQITTESEISETLLGDYLEMLDKTSSIQFLADSVQNADTVQKDFTDNFTDEELAASHQSSTDEMVEITQTPTGYYYFEVLNKPPVEAIQIDPEIPEGLNYRIQMAIFRNFVTHEFFKGITPVYGITNVNNPELKTYYAGMFRRGADAHNALAEVKNIGFNDAFIVSFLGDRSVSADRATALEQEWGTIPFEMIADNKPTQVVADRPALAVDMPPQVAAADTLPPTLVFRVEVMRVARAATPATVDALRTIAGNRGLDIITTDDRRIAYIIGRFITFESAAEYADLLVRNGYRETRVIAWLGNREMSLDTAIELFERLK